MSTLYVVATPIGNLEDITLRAVRVLGEVDVVFCEDTRVTKKLLDRFSIGKPMKSISARTEKERAADVIAKLEDGKDIAYVSDAGTPGISDPGNLLVSFVREKLPDVKIVPVPGASAISAALSVSGLPSSEFLFLGFIPNKKGREKIFKEIAESNRTVVFYESPHRIMKTLQSLATKLSSERNITVGREITKVFEEFKSGSAKDILNYFSTHSDRVRGEFVVIVGS